MYQFLTMLATVTMSGVVAAFVTYKLNRNKEESSFLRGKLEELFILSEQWFHNIADEILGQDYLYRDKITYEQYANERIRKAEQLPDIGFDYKRLKMIISLYFSSLSSAYDDVKKCRSDILDNYTEYKVAAGFTGGVASHRLNTVRAKCLERLTALTPVFNDKARAFTSAVIEISESLEERNRRRLPIPRRILLIFCLILAFCCLSGAAFGFPAKVIKVSDGDTIVVLTEDKRQVRVRLFGVDTPEKGQARGKQASDYTKSIAALQMVDVQEMDVDRYGRLVGKVTLADGRVLNAELVANGWAWVYRDYCKAAECKAWEQLEQRARAGRVGLWQDKSPQAPWEWRREQREGGQPKKPAKAKKEAAAAYHGNVSSHVFHAPGCKHYDCKNCSEVFASREAAIQAGYKPCKVCKP